MSLVVLVVPLVDPEDDDPELVLVGGGGGGCVGPGPSAYAGTEAAAKARSKNREAQIFFMGTGFSSTILTIQGVGWLNQCPWISKILFPGPNFV